VLSSTQSETAILAGDTTFDATDRLAVMNLIGAYGQSYDAGRLDKWRTLFTDSADVRFLNRSGVPSNTMSETIPLLEGWMSRRAAASTGTSRHVVNMFCFTSQDASEVN
jgi:hypothetical protein